MAINPISYTEKVTGSFLRYQLTRYPFADDDLYAQMKALLSLDVTRNSPLLKGPYISLSKAFHQGATVRSLIDEGLLHAHMANLVEFPGLYGHQEDAIRSIGAGKTTLISTGTGSGKTECFLYPIVSQCLRLRDENAPAGISAVIVYPMNALAEDQLGRLRGFLAGTGVTFAMYVGKTPETDADVVGQVLPAGATRADYLKALARAKEENRDTVVHPAEEICSRDAMRKTPPRVLITNVKQLELLLTRSKDVELFANARLDFLVFDEAHTYSGAGGAETACLIRRLRLFCKKDADATRCIATSATIADPSARDGAGAQFASRFFGVDAANVAIVGEKYADDTWSTTPVKDRPFGTNAAVLLDEIIKAVDAGPQSDVLVRAVYEKTTGRKLGPNHWQEELHSALSASETLIRIAESLSTPTTLADLRKDLAPKLGFEITEEEILGWLALGVTARKQGRPLVRPVMHVFMRGLGGAVVTFPEDHKGPRLFLSPESCIVEGERTGLKFAALPVMNCTRCGQHYFVHFVEDFDYAAKTPGGGRSVEGQKNTRFWPALDETLDGKRVVLLDTLIGEDEDLDGHGKLASVALCRWCGALHSKELSMCAGCGRPGPMKMLHVVKPKVEWPGMLSSCISCGALGRSMGAQFREPARPVKATPVADIHVLAQDMVHHADRKRLLLFCDNRQDAAFQAGWMRDHARKFRLRSIMAEFIHKGSISVGDLTASLDEYLDKDDSLSRALLPEVWNVLTKEEAGTKHQDERRRFLRLQILQELTATPRFTLGLEPWGRLRVDYLGIEPGHPYVVREAGKLGLAPDEFASGICALLDQLRRSYHLIYDAPTEVFSKYWRDGDYEIQRGYLPKLQGIPVGVKLVKDPGDMDTRVKGFLTTGGHQNTVKETVVKWGVPEKEVAAFVKDLWQFLTAEVKILVPVTLRVSSGKALPNCSGTYQIAAEKMKIAPNRGFFRCRTCHRMQVRRNPGNSCTGWRCKGTLEHIRENPDSYDLNLLDSSYEMIRPREHSAQVPQSEREKLETLFKSSSTAINALVCTPTLELGVNIGTLDTVLLRNVPPHPANYWQRVGRAGREHRIAVNITYARPMSHDQLYFADPLKMLLGKVKPPAFNLNNELMVRKHVHAAILTYLNAMMRGEHGASAHDRESVREALGHTFPTMIRNYLFDEGGVVRSARFDLSPLANVLRPRRGALLEHLGALFARGWPDKDRAVVTSECIGKYVDGMASQLGSVIDRLRARLTWAREQIQRLSAVRAKLGTLDQEDDALFKRCDEIIKRLKGQARRARREGEGFDDYNTFAVLAAEGFLPGYGLETGSITATAQMPKFLPGAQDFVLRRPTAVALREYAPGNLLYANAHRFTPRYYHFEAVRPMVFQVDAAREAVVEIGSEKQAPGAAGLGGVMVSAVPICDVDMPHFSHIKDEEEFRFHMGVAVFGYELDRHSGGTAFQWGDARVQLRKAVHMRQVNVAPSRKLKNNPPEFGYPMCLVCGATRSPLSSRKELDNFTDHHAECCGKAPDSRGFYADIVADAITIAECPDRGEAYSVLEAVRIGAAEILDMETDDLSVLVIGKPGRDDVDAVLYDPMPGGSGLLEQIVQRFDEVHAKAVEMLSECPSRCERACVDCLYTYENSFYHSHLDRKRALTVFAQRGNALTKTHAIPGKLPHAAPKRDEMPVNVAESALRAMLNNAGFEEPKWHHRIDIGPPYHRTEPDCYYADEDDDPGTCIYLDGLSNHIHGNPETAEKDRDIRTCLRNDGYDVIEIAASELYDRVIIAKYFFKLGKILIGKQEAQRLRDDVSWYVAPGTNDSAIRQREPVDKPRPEGKVLPFGIVRRDDVDAFVNCIPLMTLKAAAGGFGESFDVETAEWVAPESKRRIQHGMFIAQVVGKSMEPRIPDGAYCLFQSPVIGSRTNRILLVKHRAIYDPETGGSFTVKKFDSTQVKGKEADRTGTIYLRPLNPAFQPIVVEDGSDVEVVAEMVEVLG